MGDDRGCPFGDRGCLGAGLHGETGILVVADEAGILVVADEAGILVVADEGIGTGTGLGGVLLRV